MYAHTHEIFLLPCAGQTSNTINEQLLRAPWRTTGEQRVARRRALVYIPINDDLD